MVYEDVCKARGRHEAYITNGVIHCRLCGVMLDWESSAGMKTPKQIQDPDREMDKHWQAIVWMNGLIMDLYLQLLGHEPARPIDEERLKEWSDHRKDLERCKERIEIKY